MQVKDFQRPAGGVSPLQAGETPKYHSKGETKMRSRRWGSKLWACLVVVLAVTCAMALAPGSGAQAGRQEGPAVAQKGAEGRGGAGDAVALTNLGFAYAKAGQYEKAVEVLTRAVRLNPESAEAHYFLGAAYNNMDRFEEAVGAFREAVRLRPEWGEAYSGLGVAYNCARRFEESLAALRRQAVR